MSMTVSDAREFLRCAVIAATDGMSFDNHDHLLCEVMNDLDRRLGEIRFAYLNAQPYQPAENERF